MIFRCYYCYRNEPNSVFTDISCKHERDHLMPSVAGKGESLTSSAQITGGNNLFGGVKYGGPIASGVAHDMNRGEVLRTRDLPLEMRLLYWLHWRQIVLYWSGFKSNFILGPNVNHFKDKL